MAILFCINCGHTDEVHQGTHRVTEVHEEDDFFGRYWLEWKECSGPFAETPPPDIFFEHQNCDLSQEELEAIDENALLLLADMEV